MGDVTRMATGEASARKLCTAVIACVVLVMATVSAQTSTANAAVAQLPPSPVTMDGQGWIHFNATQSATVSLKNTVSKTQSGKRDAQGNCIFSDSGTTAAGASGTYQVEVAINPSICAEKLLAGVLTPAASKALNVTPATDTPVLSTTATANAPAVEKSYATQVAAATSSTTAYEKTSYIDPLYITITSLSANLTWSHNGSSVPGASYRIVPYNFAYDGWSTSGTPRPGFTFAGNNVHITASEQFRNNDFELLLIAIFGPLTIEHCGYSVATAVFNHSEYIQGNASGGFNWNYTDSTSGGCSNLVSHAHYSGFGSSN